MAKNNVVRISGDWTQEEILEAAMEQKFSHVMVIGWLEEPDETGKRFWISGTMEDIQSAVYAVQHANLKLLEWSRGE